MKKIGIILVSVLLLASCGIKKELVSVKIENIELKKELVKNERIIKRQISILDNTK